MLDKQNRLNSSRLFSVVYKYGKRYKGKYGMLITLLDKNYSPDNSQISPRFGFIVKKKIGNSVERHRMTRWLRELSREALKDHPTRLSGLLFSYIAFSLPGGFQELKEDFTTALEELLKQHER